MFDLPEAYKTPVQYQDAGHKDVKQAIYGNIKDLYVKFFPLAEHRPAKSSLLDLEIYEDSDFIEIIVDKFTHVHRKVTAEDKLQFAHLWDRYQKQLGSVGTLIEKWDLLGPAEKAICIGNGILTVDQLSEMSNERLGKFPAPFAELRDKAKAHVKARDGKVEVSEYGDMLVKMQQQLTVLEAKNAELEARAGQRVTRKKPARAKKSPIAFSELEDE